MTHHAKMTARAGLPLFCLGLALVLPTACATVKLEAPDKPIEINLNVNIKQEVRVRLEKDIEDLITENPDIF